MYVIILAVSATVPTVPGNPPAVMDASQHCNYAMEDIHIDSPIRFQKLWNSPKQSNGSEPRCFLPSKREMRNISLDYGPPTSDNYSISPSISRRTPGGNQTGKSKLFKRPYWAPKHVSVTSKL